jgi:hypothetical protein
MKAYIDGVDGCGCCGYTKEQYPRYPQDQIEKKVNRLIEIIDLVNDGKPQNIHMTMGEAFHLKEFLETLRCK